MVSTRTLLNILLPDEVYHIPTASISSLLPYSFKAIIHSFLLFALPPPFPHIAPHVQSQRLQVKNTLRHLMLRRSPRPLDVY